MRMTRKPFRRVLFVAAITSIVLSSILTQPATAGPSSTEQLERVLNGTARNCLGDGCTYVKVQRDGVSATVEAWGLFYTPRKKVWVQINIYNSETMEVVWSDQVLKTANLANGGTSHLKTFIDCDFPITAVAWTWLAGSNDQPEASLGWQ
jgi:hypothetical protein